MKRNIYLDMVPSSQALETIISKVKIEEKIKTIHISQALGKKTARPVYAKISNPSYNSSAMDGIAVRAEDTIGARESRPLVLRPDQFKYVNTGEPLGDGYDSVIMIEDIEETDEGVMIRSSVPVFNHIRTVGEDIVAGEMVIPSKHTLRPFDISVLVAGGISQIQVYERPTVTIIPTGSEIIEEGHKPQKGQILDSNSWMIRSRLEEIGARAEVLPITKDDQTSLKSALEQAIASSDMVILIAGSSAGSKDYTKSTIETLGQIHVHGINIKPGKPTILATSKDKKPIIGLPGYPVSCWIALENYVVPLLEHSHEAISVKDYGQVEPVVSRRLVSSLKHDEYIRVKLARVNDKLVASPLDRGAGSTMSLVRADGLGVIPVGSEGLDPGQSLKVKLFRPLEEIESSLMISGSHDLIIDEITDEARKRDMDFNISSSHIGSLGGLMALRRKETHLAPSHLLDPATGKYNDKYVEELFAGEEMAIIRVVSRIQGLIVKKTNPLGIETIEDIQNKKFINRQRGSGTRVFTDYLLDQANIDVDSIGGYDIEKSSHMDIAASVKDEADVGVGIYSSAKALDLDFIPLGDEHYEFVLYKKDLENPMVKNLLKILKSQKFKERVEKLGGYDTKDTGEIRYV